MLKYNISLFSGVDKLSEPKLMAPGIRPRNKSGRYTGHYDRWITKFTGHSGIYAGHCRAAKPLNLVGHIYVTRYI
jgi:hypothetical protein